MTPRQTAREISDTIVAQLEISLNTAIPLLPKAFNRTLAKVLGGIFVLIYNFAGDILMQLFVKHASNEPMKIGGVTITPLKEWGALVGIYQKTGQRADLQISIDVLTQGGTIESGERIANPATQLIYTVIGDVALDADTVYATIRATKAGAIGNVDAGGILQFVQAPDAVEKDVTVTSSVTTGVDPETTEVFRERIQERFAFAPQGGAYTDYVLWAEEVEGVRNAYSYSGWLDPDIPGSRAGQVFIYVESAVGQYGYPSEALMDEVWQYIEHDDSGLSSRRNINAQVKVLSIERTAFDIQVEGLFSDNNDQAKQDIAAGLDQYMAGREPGGQAGYTYMLPRKDLVTRMEIGGIVGRIASAYNGSITGLKISDGSDFFEIYPLQEGEKARVGTLTWN